MLGHRVDNKSLPHFNLDRVSCNGNETLLSNCSHGETSRYCRVEIDEAGVICNGKFLVHSIMITVYLYYSFLW